MEERFGISVDIDGDQIIVGAQLDGEDENGVTFILSAGSAFIFKRNNQATNNWPLLKKITASDRAFNHRFGRSVSISNGIAIVGSYFESHTTSLGNQMGAGAVYAFQPNANGIWSETQKLIASDGTTYDRFGSSVSISNGQLIVGAELEDHDEIGGSPLLNSGSAYIFELSPAQPTIIATSNPGGLPCAGTLLSTTLNINSGNLNAATTWQWYTGGCNGTVIGTGSSITVTPSTTTTYYVNGIGICPSTPGACGSITVPPQFSTTNTNAWPQTTKNTQGEDFNTDVATDVNDNVYVTRYIERGTVLNGGGSSDISITMGNARGSYLAKYNTCGDLLWEAHSDFSQDNQANSIVLDEINDIVYIVGNFEEELSFITSNNPFNSPIVINASASTTGYVAGFNMSTGLEESLDAVIQLDPYTTCEAITIDENNATLFIGGTTSDNFNGMSHSSYIHKYQPSNGSIGNVLDHIESVSEPYDNQINDMDYDEITDQLYAIGSFDTEVEFDPGYQIQTSNSQVISDAFLLSYENSPNGFSTVFNRSGNGLYYMTGDGIVIDPLTGNFYVTGTFQEDVIAPFQYNSINNLPGFTNKTAYMIGFNVDTQNGWSRYGNVPIGEAFGKSVAFKDKYAYFTGNFSRRNINIQGIGTYPAAPITSSHISHIYSARYNENGNGIWGNVTTDPIGTAAHHATSIAVNNNGQLFVVGDYLETIDYYIASSISPLASTGTGRNAFILRAESQGGQFLRTKPGIEQSEGLISTSNLSIAPNPTNGIGTLTIQNFDDEKKHTLRIIDMLGKVVLEEVINTSEIEFDLSQQRNGLYYIQINNGENISFKKVIKTN